MRQAGTLTNRQDAQRLAEYLTVQGIRCRVDASSGESVLWIINEEDVPRSREILATFLENPGDPKFQIAPGAMEALERDALQKQRAYEKNLIDARQRIGQAPIMRRPVCLTLAGMSVLVYLLAHPENPLDVWANRLWISLHAPTHQWPFGLLEIARGEIWRLVTPIFIHMSVMHIVFNLMWLISAGTLFETLFGSMTFLAFCLVAAVISNLTQFFWDGPWFGGMSGVGFAIFGFLWAYSHLGPLTPFRLHPQTVFMFLLWYVLCVTDVVPHVANAAHTGGLIFGVIAAAARAQVDRGRQ